MNRLLASTLAGTLATVPMTVAMAAVKCKVGPHSEPLPPETVARRLFRRIGLSRHTSEEHKESLTWLSHLAYAAGSGAASALVEPAASRHPIAVGSLFGLGVWAASYLGWLPAAGILSPSGKRGRRRNTSLIAAHLVWGITTTLLTRALTSERQGRGW